MEKYHPHITTPNKLTQSVDVLAVSPGKVESIGIETGGDGYKVILSYLIIRHSGFGCYCKSSNFEGKQVNSVSVATTNYRGRNLPSSKGEYILFADNPRNFKKFNRVLVTGLSTTSSKIGGSYPVGVSSNNTLVGVGTTSGGVGNVSATGIVTILKWQAIFLPFHQRKWNSRNRIRTG